MKTPRERRDPGDCLDQPRAEVEQTDRSVAGETLRGRMTSDPGVTATQRDLPLSISSDQPAPGYSPSGRGPSYQRGGGPPGGRGRISSLMSLPSPSLSQ